jgi:four helix bundle protein
MVDDIYKWMGTKFKIGIGPIYYTVMIALTDLEVYMLSEKLSDKIWQDYDNWPRKAQWTIGLQIIRSSDSIAANIAEGYGRFTPLDRIKFYRYSRGSFEETKAWLRKAFRRKLIENSRMEEYNLIVQELGPKLNAFINATKLRS